MKNICGVESFKDVNDQIINWNYEPIKGVSLYTKSERYAHIEINIHTSDHYEDKVVWSVEEKFIPTKYRQEIEDVLTFFANYLTALKGRRSKRLVFEIIDGSYKHDSRPNAFMCATVWALVSCFDKKIFEITPIKFNLITRVKDAIRSNAIKILKNY